MVVDAVGRFTQRRDDAASKRALRALTFLASKSPEMRTAMKELAENELARRHGTKT